MADPVFWIVIRLSAKLREPLDRLDNAIKVKHVPYKPGNLFYLVTERVAKTTRDFEDVLTADDVVPEEVSLLNEPEDRVIPLNEQHNIYAMLPTSPRL